jgi:hypothetical protein
MTDSEGLSFQESSRTVEEALATHFGLDPRQNRLETQEASMMAWGLTKGSASIFISLTWGQRNQTLQIFSPILVLTPQVNLNLYPTLLGLNASNELVGAAFAIRDNKVILKVDRNARDLSVAAVTDMIRRIGTLADRYDDLLVEQFGGALYGTRT